MQNMSAKVEGMVMANGKLQMAGNGSGSTSPWPSPPAERVPDAQGLVTRQGLAQALHVSVSTVDRMLADGEITPVRLRGKLVRFCLPDVMAELKAKAMSSKRNCTRRI